MSIESQDFDFIVVGAGSAGAPIAARLSESGEHNVCLVEPGGKTATLNHRIPLNTVNIMQDSRWAWQFTSGPENALKGQNVFTPRGLGLGGSSAINGMLWTVGDRAAWNHWAELGNTDWNWQNVQPYLNKAEDYAGGNIANRGRGGPIRVEEQPRERLGDAFLESCRQAGFESAGDYNDGATEGYAYLQTNTRAGLRCSTYDGYLKPNLSRQNLKIETGWYAERLLLNGAKAEGVEIVRRNGDAVGERMQLRARREVILCAGAYHTPMLLERSGIGDPDRLKSMGVEVVHANPHVGEHLQDHMRSCVTWKSKDVFTVNDIINSPFGKVRAGLEFILGRRGWLRTVTMNSQLMTRSFPEAPWPDLKLQLNAIANDYSEQGQLGYPVEAFSGYSILTFPVHPRSQGRIHVSSMKPWDPPEILANYYDDPHDQKVALAGIKLARKIGNQQALKKFALEETFPGVEATSDQDLLDYIKGTGLTVYHPVGSCRMGREGEAVVDQKLRVYGLSGLRIADASIMPAIPATNTNAPCIMIGERVADFILQAAKESNRV